MRRFEFKEGSSSKFWEISREGKVVAVRFGRIGSAGQSKSKSFGTEDAALMNELESIAEKLAKGYVEISADGAPVERKAPNPAAREPGDGEGLRVRFKTPDGGGAIIAQLGRYVILGEGPDRSLQDIGTRTQAAEHFKRLKMLREKEGWVAQELEKITSADIDPPTALETSGFDGELKLENGRLAITFRGAEDVKVPAPVCRALVDRIAETGPHRVQILCDFASPGPRWQKALEGRELPSVESFVFDTHFQSQSRQGKNSIGDLSAVLSACPALRNLFAVGSLSLEPCVHERLSTLHLMGDPLSLACLENLGKCRMPSLSFLAISISSDIPPKSKSSLISALRSMDAQSLRTVHIDGVWDHDRFLMSLFEKPLPAQIKEISLAGEAEIDFDDLDKVIASARESAPGLEILDVKVDSAAFERGRERLPCLRAEGAAFESFLPKAYASW